MSLPTAEGANRPVVPRQTEESFRALFEQAPIPYHEIDQNGMVVRINRAECELLHVRAEDVIGRRCGTWSAPTNAS